MVGSVENERGGHGHHWDDYAVVWCDASGIDEVHNEASNDRYVFFPGLSLGMNCSCILLWDAVLQVLVWETT